MTSRITIEVDFENGNQPVIQIISPIDSDDVRDKLIKSFLQSFQGLSSWLTIDFQERHREGEMRVIIRPVKPEQIMEQSAEMQERVKDYLERQVVLAEAEKPIKKNKK